MKSKSNFNWPNLINWFVAQKRDLPWRHHPNPYAVWVSEVMLQQTQVNVVIPYFTKWMDRFPNVEQLAEAPLHEVIKLWEGLGYYSRARHLHEGARFVVDHYKGKIPSCPNELKKIKGLGPYTIGAILSFAFHQRVAAVDGNVLRVLTRYYCMDDDISKAISVKKIREKIENQLPDDNHWLANEGLIELGATICSRKPNCLACPLKKDCGSFLHGSQGVYPKKSKQPLTTILHRCVTVIFSDQSVLLHQGQLGKIMADLYEFPYFETEASGFDGIQATRILQKSLGIMAKYERKLQVVKHSFTRYRAHLTPMVFKADPRHEIEGYYWHSIEDLSKLPFSAGHRRIAAQLAS